ncbi:MAG: DUF1499 domain-containing protein [Panacagrimonas sp.]
MKKIFVLLALAIVIVAGFGVYKTLTPPEDLYGVTGDFMGCPTRPSCVSSVATDDQHRVAALGHTGDTLRALSMLREVIERMGGTIEFESPGYLHAVFVTPTMRYRDDLELLVLPEGKIEVRSISRFGYRDFGINRERVEKLRQAFETVPSP